MRCVVVLMLLGACGRLGFDGVAATDPDPDSGISDPDAPPGSVVARFGERPDSDTSGVTTDAQLNRESPTSNSGASGSMSIEGSEKRALLRFDVSSLAASSIVSARLELVFSGQSATISIAPLLESWNEDTVSWNSRDTGQAWTDAGASPPGSAGAALTAGSANGTVSFDIPPTTIASWMATPGSNFGVVLSASGGGEPRVSTSEAPIATERPSLVVTYFP